MKFDILTLFPDFFDKLNDFSIIGRALEGKKISINSINIRDFSKDKHKRVDDYSYGGGPGMVMTVEPIFHALDSVKSKNSKTIFLSPQGKQLNQKIINDLSKEEHLIFLCGHYEGIDNRIVSNYIDIEVSIGNYVLTGGEIPTLALIDSITRLLPGVLTNEESFTNESHYDGLLEYPQYTRPREFMGHEVPEILLSGDHKKIEEWREYQSIETTLKKRPDLLDEICLDEEKQKILKEIMDKEKLL